MEWWQSIILGIVEGLTEYLPVSSTGHLLLAQQWLGIPRDEAADAYAICIQAGAILAVLGLYWKRVLQMIMGVLGKDPEGLRLALNIVAAFLPAAFAGLVLEKPIKHFLFGAAWGLWPIVAAWLLGGIAIIAVSAYRKKRGASGRKGFDLSSLTWQHAVIIGVAQCLAMWPGTSRSLVTIVGGILIGLSMASAVEFSFLLGVVTLGAATAHDGLKSGAVMLSSYGVVSLLIGLVAAFVSAVIAVRWMVAYLNRHGLDVFGYYRIALALIAGALILAGPLRPAATTPAPTIPASVEDAQTP